MVRLDGNAGLPLPFLLVHVPPGVLVHFGPNLSQVGTVVGLAWEALQDLVQECLLLRADGVLNQALLLCNLRLREPPGDPALFQGTPGSVGSP